jgi:hypothetical protein
MRSRRESAGENCSLTGPAVVMTSGADNGWSHDGRTGRILVSEGNVRNDEAIAPVRLLQASLCRHRCHPLLTRAAGRDGGAC